ncbi:hypothetical protein LP420_16010 [Massilia sp. B-10]|nr:hypothetical protein LP420_16010 [Massilia sp. B-10]
MVRIDFLRTWEKYGDFAYRLSAVDTGLVTGRLAALAARMGELAIDVDFDGPQLDRALGLDEETQASYCVLRLVPRGGRSGSAVRSRRRTRSRARRSWRAASACRAACAKRTGWRTRGPRPRRTDRRPRSWHFATRPSF